MTAALTSQSAIFRQRSHMSPSPLCRLDDLHESLAVGTLYFDGATGPSNPGHSACGVVLDYNGQHYERSKALGHTTNNVAEWHGLILGLELAQSLGIQRLYVFGDSNLVVQQVNGLWRAKAEPLVPLVQKGKALKRNFTECVIQWVPREQNAKADAVCGERFKQEYKQEPFDAEKFRAAKAKKGSKALVKEALKEVMPSIAQLQAGALPDSSLLQELLFELKRLNAYLNS